MPERTGYRVIPFPRAQRQAVDWHAIMSRQHTIHGLLEFDVTEARRAIHAWRRASRQPLSFTALLVASFAHAIGEDPALHAYRKGRRQVVLFDDVDVAVLVEQLIDGERIPVLTSFALQTERPRPRSIVRSGRPRTRATRTVELVVSSRCGSCCRRLSGGSR
jgi:hypothetical protein